MLNADCRRTGRIIVYEPTQYRTLIARKVVFTFISSRLIPEAEAYSSLSNYQGDTIEVPYPNTQKQSIVVCSFQTLHIHRNFCIAKRHDAVYRDLKVGTHLLATSSSPFSKLVSLYTSLPKQFQALALSIQSLIDINMASPDLRRHPRPVHSLKLGTNCTACTKIKEVFLRPSFS